MPHIAITRQNVYLHKLQKDVSTSSFELSVYCFVYSFFFTKKILWRVVELNFIVTLIVGVDSREGDRWSKALIVMKIYFQQCERLIIDWGSVLSYMGPCVNLSSQNSIVTLYHEDEKKKIDVLFSKEDK